MRCLWKVVIPPELKPGNQLSSRDVLGYMELFISFCGELGVPLFMGWGSLGISGVSWWGGELRLSLGSPQRIQISLHLVRWKTSLHLVTTGKSSLLSLQGISVSILLDAANSGFLSHSYSCDKPPLDVLVQRCQYSWVEAQESAIISRWFGVHGGFLELLCWHLCSSRLGTVFSRNIWSFWKEVKHLGLFDGECRMALEAMQ